MTLYLVMLYILSKAALNGVGGAGVVKRVGGVGVFKVLSECDKCYLAV